MRKVIPQNLAADFQVQEMFYSRTDLKGLIKEGNDVFTRISEYAEEELLGKPHNIIRHPDMPRTVFRYFWKTIQSGQPIAAYVKNMTSTGKYYWVLASVFPEADGYVSIRVKPSSEIFSKVDSLYSQLLAYEKNHSDAESDDFLMKKIEQLGFADYRYFAIEALAMELDGRRKAIMELNHRKNAFTPHLNHSRSIYIRTLQLLKLKDELAKNAMFVGENYRLIKFVGINMMSEVEKLGKDATTISIVAQTFESWAEEVNLASEKMMKSIQAMTQDINQASLILASSRFQLEMCEFEMVRNASRATLEFFFDLCHKAMGQVMDITESTLGQCGHVSLDLDQLTEAISALQIIHQNGKIEVAKLSVESKETTSQLDSMRQFIETVRASSRLIHELNSHIRDELKAVHADSELIIKGLQNFLLRTAS